MQNSQHSQKASHPKEAPTGHWVTSETRKTSTLPNEEKKPWFTALPLGKKSLQNMVKTVCNSAAMGITGKKTNHRNHSLRATIVLLKFNMFKRENCSGKDCVHSKLYKYMSALTQNSIKLYVSTILSTKQTTFQQQMVQKNINASTKPNV